MSDPGNRDEEEEGMWWGAWNMRRVPSWGPSGPDDGAGFAALGQKPRWEHQISFELFLYSQNVRTKKGVQGRLV